VSPGEPAATGGESLRVPCLHNPQDREVAAHLGQSRYVWLDYEDPSDEEVRKLAELVKLHPLTVEDARMFKQRPKMEEYEGYLFMVVFGVDPGTESGGPLLREVHMIISGDYVITIHRRPFDALADLRTRYNNQPIRSEQFMVYKILDAITSTFVPVLTRIDDQVDEVEQQVLSNASPECLERIYGLKRDLVAMRRVITPMRDMFARNAERIAELPGMQADTRLYYRDLYDGLIRVSDLVDAYRDLLSGATDLYLSAVTNRQGDINKQLTMIATIFLPLTFLTGFFGQNFAFMTGHITDSLWSFLVFGIGLLIASAIALALYFRRKGWF
jgi:magnesium transporter